jgi:hypothetical protein
MSKQPKQLGDLIEKAIDAEIARRLGQVSNPALRGAVEELLRDAAAEKIERAMTSRPPKPLDIAKAVQESVDELSASIKGLKKTSALNRSFQRASSNDNGGKDSDYGGKYSPPARTPSFGGKDGYDYGGK